MLVVGTSLARAFGIVGAAGLVRYRAKVEDPKDAGVMLSTLAIGLATGVGQWPLAIVGTVFLLVLLVGRRVVRAGGDPRARHRREDVGPAVVEATAENGCLRRQAARFEVQGDVCAKNCSTTSSWPVDRPTDGLSERIAGMDPKNSVDVSIEQSKDEVGTRP